MTRNIIFDMGGVLIYWDPQKIVASCGLDKADSAILLREVFYGFEWAAMDHGLKKVTVFVKGPGSGRETAIRSLQAAGLEVSGIQDKTPIPHNGCRPKKRRRV